MTELHVAHDVQLSQEQVDRAIGALVGSGVKTRDGRKLSRTNLLAARSPGMNQLRTDQR